MFPYTNRVFLNRVDCHGNFIGKCWVRNIWLSRTGKQLWICFGFCLRQPYVLNYKPQNNDSNRSRFLKGLEVEEFLCFFSLGVLFFVFVFVYVLRCRHMYVFLFSSPRFFLCFVYCIIIVFLHLLVCCFVVSFSVSFLALFLLLSFRVVSLVV